MHVRRFLMTLVTAVALASFAAPSAHACTCAPQAIYRSDPEDGTDGVPLNKALVIQGAFVRDSVALEDEAGETASMPGVRAPLAGRELLHVQYRFTPKLHGAAIVLALC